MFVIENLPVSKLLWQCFSLGSEPLLHRFMRPHQPDKYLGRARLGLRDALLTSGNRYKIIMSTRTNDSELREIVRPFSYVVLYFAPHISL